MVSSPDFDRIRLVVDEINRETEGSVLRYGFEFTGNDIDLLLESRTENEAEIAIRAIAEWMVRTNSQNHDGVTLTPVLVKYLVGKGDIHDKLGQLDDLRLSVRQGKFDVTNLVQRDTEFHRYDHIYSDEDLGDFSGKADRYKAFTQLPLLEPQTEDRFVLDGQNLVEARRTAYEAFGFLKFVEKFRGQTSRPIVIVGNDRYGRQWAVEPIEEHLEGIQLLYPRVPSHKSFRLRVPHMIENLGVRSGFHREFVQYVNDAMPHIIVVDARNVGQDNMMRLSRGTRDYANWFLLFNDLRSQGDLSKYADLMPLPRQHIDEIKRWHQFEIVRRMIRPWVSSGQPYAVSMWAPVITQAAMLGDFIVPTRPVEYGSDEPQVVLANPIVYQTDQDDLEINENLRGNRPYYYDGPERHVRHDLLVGFGDFGLETRIEGNTTDEFVHSVQTFMREEISRLLAAQDPGPG